VRIVLIATGASEEVDERLSRLAARARELLGDVCIGEGEEGSLEAVVGALLVERGATIAVAESCTGGLVCQRITSVPGSSRYFPGGVVTYSDAQKSALLGVAPALLAEHGAVSEPVARAMAEGVRRRFGSALGVGVTGVAGPDGGSAAKPVGTVHVAVAGPASGSSHHRFLLPGDRERVRRQASQAALDLVRRALLGLAGVAS
jgi:nicotinamide-nucleotide amidase